MKEVQRHSPERRERGSKNRGTPLPGPGFTLCRVRVKTVIRARYEYNRGVRT